MSLPLSFAREGFVTPGETRTKIKLPNGQFLKPLLIGSDGDTDSGKTEFAISIPGKGQVIAVDRNFSGVFDNPEPPDTRNPNVAIKVISVPLEGMMPVAECKPYFESIRDSYNKALSNPDSTFVVLDGDSDFYELHTLVHYGKTKQIFPQTRWGELYAEKRIQIARAFDSGKIVLFTNRVRDEYEPVLDANGNEQPDPANPKDVLKRKSGAKVAAGFKDHGYLYQVWLTHLYRPKGVRMIGKREVEVPQQWGIRVGKCKHNMAMVGTELWGDQCNFRGLVETLYPDVDIRRWGFEK